VHSRALAPIWHVRVAIVAVVAPAHVAVGAARGVEALAVLADAAIVGPLRRRRARRLVERPVQDGRDHEAGGVAGVEKRQLDRDHVLPVAPPLLLHHEHAGAGRHPRRPGRGVLLQPGKPDVEGRGEARRDGRLAAADPVAGPVPELPLLGSRTGRRARAERGGVLPSPRGGLEAAADEDEAVPRGGEHVPAEGGREHVYLRGPRGAGGEGPDRAADAHRAVPEGHLQHLRAAAAAAPQEELRRLVRAVAGDLEARPVAAVAGAERVRHVHAAALTLATGQGDARRSRRRRGGGHRELRQQQQRHGEATHLHLTRSRRLFLRSFEFACVQCHVMARARGVLCT
jgi:hypothetical protein